MSRVSVCLSVLLRALYPVDLILLVQERITNSGIPIHFGLGAPIHKCQEIQCLPYVRFFYDLHFTTTFSLCSHIHFFPLMYSLIIMGGNCLVVVYLVCVTNYTDELPYTSAPLLSNFPMQLNQLNVIFFFI